MATKIFVYGTLLRGFGNWSWALKDQTFISVGETAPEYTMVSLGGFPGVCLNGNTAIHGEVFEVNDSRLRDIDSLEGYSPSNPSQGLYDRKTVTLTDGTEALMYVFNNNRNGMGDYPAIESGSWRQHTGKYLQNNA